MKNACASFAKPDAVNSLLVWNAFQTKRLSTTSPNARDLKRNKNMTKKQYENLKIGDLVTCSGGPNKNVIMRVIRKYFGCGGSNCLKADGIEPNTVYNQRKAFRNDNWTCGAASCFKVIKGTM